MVLALKYIEDKIGYEIDEYFYSKLSEFPLDDAGIIIGQCLSVIEKLPERGGWGQEVAGVVLKRNPIFFIVEYLNQPNEIPILLDLNQTDIDTYLDFISNNQTIKQLYYDGTRNGNTDEERTGDKFFKRDYKNNSRSRSKK